MNANIKNMLEYHKRKSINQLIITGSGFYLTDKQARAYLRWGLKNGYTDLKSMPEFEEVKDKLNL